MDNLTDFSLTSDPFQSFNHWFEEAKRSGDSSDQFVLSTCSEEKPSARVLLLKEMRSTGPIFFTNYGSRKGVEIAKNDKVSLVFWWPKLGRQVHIGGIAKKIAPEESEKYFYSRDKSSQIASAISFQSTVIKDREELESKFIAAQNQFQNTVVPCPKEWGGYQVTPTSWEFFLYREHRLNDRFEFVLKSGSWTWQRLSP